MKKKVFSQLLLVFSFIALLGACSYYTYEKGYNVGRYYGAYDICTNDGMILSFDKDSNYICEKNITEEEEKNQFDISLEGNYGFKV